MKRSNLLCHFEGAIATEKSSSQDKRFLPREHKVLATLVEMTTPNLDFFLSDARLKMAASYLKQNRTDDYATEMAALIEEFPFIYKYYNITARELISAGKFSRGYYFLKRGFIRKPDAFNSKWLGIIDLTQGFVDDAIVYLETSLRYDNKDAQTYFNITGAYAQKKEFNKALESINKCLQINPDFQRAEQIRQQLEAIISQKNFIE